MWLIGFTTAVKARAFQGLTDAFQQYLGTGQKAVNAN